MPHTTGYNISSDSPTESHPPAEGSRPAAALQPGHRSLASGSQLSPVRSETRGCTDKGTSRTRDQAPGAWLRSPVCERCSRVEAARRAEAGRTEPGSSASWSSPSNTATSSAAAPRSTPPCWCRLREAAEAWTRCRRS